MANLQSLLKEQIAKILGFLFVALSGTLWTLSESLQIFQKFVTISSVIWVKLVLTLFLLCLTLIAYIFIQHAKLKNTINMADYIQPDELGGVSQHKDTKKLYCTSCLLKNIPSPVRTFDHYWICLSKECMLKYGNPQNPPPQKSRVIHPGVRRDSFVNRWRD